MVMVVILLVILIIVNNDKTPPKGYYDGTYTKIINNYIDNEKYSTTKEVITISDDILSYRRIINYEDYNNNSKTYMVTGRIENNEFILPTGEKVKIEKNRIYIDNESLSTSEKTFDNYINSIDYENHILETKDVMSSLNDEDIRVIIFTQNNCSYCKDYEQVLKNTIIDFDIDFYYYNLSEAKKADIEYWVEKYNISETPTTIIFKGKEIINVELGVLSEEYLGQLLFEQGIKSR